MIIGARNRTAVVTLNRTGHPPHPPSRSAQRLPRSPHGPGHLRRLLPRSKTSAENAHPGTKGREMANWCSVEQQTGLSVYFCDPRSPGNGPPTSTPRHAPPLAAQKHQPQHRPNPPLHHRRQPQPHATTTTQLAQPPRPLQSTNEHPPLELADTASPPVEAVKEKKVGSPYTDLGSATKSAYDAVTACTNWVWFRGINDTSYGPSVLIIRAAMAEFIAGVFGSLQRPPGRYQHAAVTAWDFGAIDTEIVVSYRTDTLTPMADVECSTSSPVSPLTLIARLLVFRTETVLVL